MSWLSVSVRSSSASLPELDVSEEDDSVCSALPTPLPSTPPSLADRWDWNHPMGDPFAHTSGPLPHSTDSASSTPTSSSSSSASSSSSLRPNFARAYERTMGLPVKVLQPHFELPRNASVQLLPHAPAKLGPVVHDPRVQPLQPPQGRAAVSVRSAPLSSPNSASSLSSGSSSAALYSAQPSPFATGRSFSSQAAFSSVFSVPLPSPLTSPTLLQSALTSPSSLPFAPYSSVFASMDNVAHAVHAQTLSHVPAASSSFNHHFLSPPLSAQPPPTHSRHPAHQPHADSVHFASPSCSTHLHVPLPRPRSSPAPTTGAVFAFPYESDADEEDQLLLLSEEAQRVKHERGWTAPSFITASPAPVTNSSSAASSSDYSSASSTPTPSSRSMAGRPSSAMGSTRPCLLCGLVLEHDLEHVQHMLYVHSVYHCVVCGHGCASHAEHDAHLLSHNPSRHPFACTLCGKGFTKKYNMSIHSQSHHSLKRHQCPVCAHRYSQKSYLRLHMRVHSGDKPYECRYRCGKRFGMKSDVKKHERVHSGEKPYTCKDCNRGFNHSSNYNRHIRKRAGKCTKDAAAADGGAELVKIEQVEQPHQQ